MNIQQHKHDLLHACPVCGDDEHALRWVDQSIWARPDMLACLAKHDIKGVFRLLQRFGVSQRKIAARTRQSQSEISEILAGRRVTHYEVLVRIAKGLEIPRGWMGLAYSTEDGEPSH